MDRRSCLCVIAVCFTPYIALAQALPVPVVGFIRRTAATGSRPFVAAFIAGLREAGFIEGQTVAVEYRWAEDRVERLPQLVAELVRKPCAVIVAGGNEASIAAKSATSTIPIVFATGDDPVRLGIVHSLNRPGGNITGIAFGNSDIVSKRLQLLRELVPGAFTVGFLVNPATALAETYTREVQEAARTTGQRIVVMQTATERDFEPAFAQLAQQRVGALLVGSGALFTNQRERIATLAARHSMPAMFDIREGVEAGGLISYGSSITDAYRRAGNYVGQILKGAKPEEMPVLQPNEFELVINLRTAKALGLSVPQSLLVRAEAIE